MIVAELLELYRGCQSEGRHLFIAPLTTKWEAVGVWEFFRTAPRPIDASVVYAASGRYNVVGYTREESGETLIADVAF
jgi:hypothetical protein